MRRFWLREHIPHSKTTEEQAKDYKEARVCGRVDTNSCKDRRGEQHSESHVYQTDKGEGDPEGRIVFWDVRRILGVG